MFNKGKTNKASTATNGSAASQAQNAANGAAAHRKMPSGVPSIISTDLTIEGDLKSIGDIQVDGTVVGDIESNSLTIGDGALVRGVVVAERVRVCGRLEGEIKAKMVVLTGSSHVLGDIEHESLEMEAGAFLHGHCRRADFKMPSAEEEKTTWSEESDPAASSEGGITLTALEEVEKIGAKA